MLSKWFRTSALWAFRVQLGLNGLGSEGGCPQGPEGPGQDEVHELGTQFGLELWSSEQEAAGGRGWGCLGFCFPADREISCFLFPAGWSTLPECKGSWRAQQNLRRPKHRGSTAIRGFAHRLSQPHTSAELPQLTARTHKVAKI